MTAKHDKVDTGTPMVKAEGIHKSFGPCRSSRASTWR